MTPRPCPFCSHSARKFGSELTVYEDGDVLVVPCLDQKPANRGHCLVISRVHVPSIYELPDPLAGPVLRAVSAAARATKKAFAADCVSVGHNNDAASGQDVFTPS